MGLLNEFAHILKDDFQKRKTINHRFSLRSYARVLNISPGSLSEILNGKYKKQISRRKIEEMLTQIQLTVNKKNSLLVRIGAEPNHAKVPLKLSQYNLIADWRIYAVLFHFDLPAKERTVDKIADRLQLKNEEVEEIISVLLREEMLVKDADGNVIRRERFLTTTDRKEESKDEMTPVEQSEAIAKHHKNNLDLAGKALQTQTLSQRDFTSLTFAGSSKKIDFLRAEIRKLHEKASAIVDDGENDTVYRLSVQLFPMDFKNDH